MIWLAIIAVLLLAIIALMRRRNSSQTKHSIKHHAHNKLAHGKPGHAKTGHESAPAHGEYHCVTVHCGPEVCAGVAALQGKSLLPQEAPSLPVAGCDALQCKCRYQHHEDRRIKSRRDPYGEFSSVTIGTVSHQPRARIDRRRNKPKPAKR